MVEVVPKLPVDRLQHLPLLLLRVEAGVQLGLHLVQGQLQALVLQLDGLHLLAAAAALGLQLPDLVVLLSKLLLPLVDAPSHLPQLTNLQQPIGDGFHKAKWKFSILKKVLQKCRMGSHTKCPFSDIRGWLEELGNDSISFCNCVIVFVVVLVVNFMKNLVPLINVAVVVILYKTTITASKL